jgi:hypothetical protein
LRIMHIGLPRYVQWQQFRYKDSEQLGTYSCVRKITYSEERLIGGVA